MKDNKVIPQKIEEPANEYETAPIQQGIGKDFDFDKAFAEGLTIEEARADIHKRIAKWNWEK